MKTLFFLLIGPISLLVIVLLLAKGRRTALKKEAEFETLYNETQSEVDAPGKMFSPEVIKSKLKRLENMAWNRDKTDVLVRAFWKKYYPPTVEKMSVHEQVELENATRV